MNIGSPWVYIFSRFTSEALLFEALAIFTLSAVYTGFWLLRKRKYGVAQHEVPAGVVKYYLNELIVDAEQIRAQLFGLLAGHGIQATPLAGVNLGSNTAQLMASGASVAAATPATAQTLVVLETKIAEQAKQIEVFVAEKTKVEKELVEVKAAKVAGAATGGDPNALAKLQEKIAQLEGKLSEYSVIEDDLANLKRLQQENAALKAQLAGKGAPVAAVAAEVAAPAPAPVAAAVQTPAPEAAAPAPAPAPAAAVAAVPTPAPAPAVTAVATETILEAAPVEAPSAEFEGLVDQVEQSLAQPAAPAAAAPAPVAEAASTTAAPAATIEKSDADLVAEFEKMLNG